MKGSTRRPLHSRAQSQGQISLNLNDCTYQPRDLHSSNTKYNSNYTKDEQYLQLQTPYKTPAQQSSNSSFWNNSFKSQPLTSQNFSRTGLCFNINRVNELKQIDQQSLTMLRKTNAFEFYDSKKSNEVISGSFFNKTLYNSPDKKTPTMDYFSRNISTNQILFKKGDQSGLKTTREQFTRESQSVNGSNIKEHISVQQDKGIQNFVKGMYDKEQQQKNKHKTRTSMKLKNLQEPQNSIYALNSTPMNSTFGLITNTPKPTDIFVTRLNNIEFSPQVYSTILKEQDQKQEKRLNQPNASESTRAQRSSLYIQNKLIDSNESPYELFPNFKKQNHYNEDHQQKVKTNQECEVSDLQIGPAVDLNDQAQNKILASFKKTGEIDKNNVLKPVPSLNLKKLHHKHSQESILSVDHVSQSQVDQNLHEKVAAAAVAKQGQYHRKQLSLNEFKDLKNFNRRISFYALFIFIDNLSNVKRKSNLKYKIVQIPFIYDEIPKKKVDKDFEELKSSLQHHIGLNIKYLFFFKQNGTPLQNHLSFQTVDYNNEAIFFGQQGVFQGVQNIGCSSENKDCLYSSIQNLCRKVKILNFNLMNNSQNTTIKNEEGHLNNNTAALTQINNLETFKDLHKYKILTKEELTKMKNGGLVNKIAQTLTFNPTATIQRLYEERPSKTELKYSKIESEYQNEINRKKKIIIEQHDSVEQVADRGIKKNLREVAKYIDDFILDATKRISKKERTRIKEEKKISSHYQGLEDLWNSQQQKEKTNFIQENIEKYHNKNSIMRTLEQKNQELFLQNIPKLLQKYDLSRHDLHSIYILYKALLTVSVQRTNYKEVYEKGVNFSTFELGIDRLSSQGEEIIKRMCGYNSFINWEQFLEILSSIQGKDLESKINIFIKVCDTDKSGNLSKNEIEELCKICLEKFLPQGEDNIIEQLIEYFTRLLFQSLEIDIEDEIPLYKIKEAIIGGHPESDLLCFFCGVN